VYQFIKGQVVLGVIRRQIAPVFHCCSGWETFPASRLFSSYARST
jgi:hypothetical protein